MDSPPIKKRSPSHEQCPLIRVRQEPIDSYLRTPFTAPKHRRAVHWEKNIPDSCRRGARDVDRARKDFILNLVRRLAEENKAVWTVRWLADGVTLDWIYDKGASERFQLEIKEESPSTNQTVFPSMGGIDYLDLTVHDIPCQQPATAQRTETRLDQPATGVDAHEREAYGQPHERLRRDNTVHSSTHTPIKTGSVDLFNGEDLSMHDVDYTSDQMDIDSTDVSPRVNPQPMLTLASDDLYLHLPALGPGEDETVTTYPSPPPRNTDRPHSRLARIDDGSQESEASSSEEWLSSTEGHPTTTMPPISGGGEWSMPPNFVFPQLRIHRPSPSGNITSSSHPPTHATGCTPSTPRYSREGRSLHRAGMISSRPSVIGKNRCSTVPKGSAEKKPLPRSSQQPKTKKQPTAPKLPNGQYYLAEDMPILLPRSPCTITRARRLLLPSRESSPIAWVSMRGDAQWVDSEGRYWKQNWSVSAIEDEDFCVGDACRLDDETIVQAHLVGSHRFSVVTEHGGNIQPTRCHLVPVPEADRPKTTSIAVATPTTFITGDQNHLIQLWSLKRERGVPTIDKVGEAISDSHRSAITSIAMGRNDHLWSAAGKSLLGTDIRDSRTVFPLTQKANDKITQLHFLGGLLLLETTDLDHPFRLYDTKTSFNIPVALFGVADRMRPYSFQRGGWVNSYFAHGLTTCDNKEYVVLWELRNHKMPLQKIELPNHTGTHCAFSKGGKELIVTGKHHISFLTL